jgi:hypothetical protein
MLPAPRWIASLNVTTTFAPIATAVASSAGLKVDAVDKVFLLEVSRHPLVTLLTNIGRTADGIGWKGAGLLKAPCFNPEFA